MGEINDKCFILIPLRLDTECVLQITSILCRLSTRTNDTVWSPALMFPSRRLRNSVLLRCEVCVTFTQRSDLCVLQRDEPLLNTVIDHTLHISTCVASSVLSSEPGISSVKLKCSQLVWDVPVTAIMFVFQELRDDMASILADVFCILGKSAPANDD